MKKKRLLLTAGLLVMLASAGFVIMLAVQDSPGVTKANLDRIEEGMTRKEVEAIFGCQGAQTRPYRRGSVIKWLAEDGGSATVDFDLDGFVRGTDWTDANETILQKLRRWLHL
jgi:hypothetical protein